MFNLCTISLTLTFILLTMKSMEPLQSPQPQQRLQSQLRPQLQAPVWIASLRTALNHGGTRRKKRDRSEAKRKQVQVSTVSQESSGRLRPSCRTMVFRGFCSAAVTNLTTNITSDDMKDGSAKSIIVDTTAAAPFPMLVTDTRSRKYADFIGGSDCEICWWLDEAGVQFRIAGRVLLATGDTKMTSPALWNARRDVWERLSNGSRRTFFWEGEPGTTKNQSDISIGDATNNSSNSVGIPTLESVGISPYFALCIIIPDRVDELHLGGNQKRFIHSLEILEDTAGSSCCGGDHADTGDIAQLLLQPQEWTTNEVNP